jgi:hypothetical protein
LGRSLLIVSVISGAVSVFRLLSSLFLIYTTLGWKVRKARKAFEKELVKEGMPKEAARRMSARYAALKDEALSFLKTRAMSFSPMRDLDSVDGTSDEKRVQILGIKF